VLAFSALKHLPHDGFFLLAVRQSFSCIFYVTLAANRHKRLAARKDGHFIDRE